MKFWTILRRTWSSITGRNVNRKKTLNDRFPYPFMYVNSWRSTWNWNDFRAERDEPSHIGRYREYRPGVQIRRAACYKPEEWNSNKQLKTQDLSHFRKQLHSWQSDLSKDTALFHQGLLNHQSIAGDKLGACVETRRLWNKLLRVQMSARTL